jgi:hypothetical protein
MNLSSECATILMDELTQCSSKEDANGCDSRVSAAGRVRQCGAQARRLRIGELLKIPQHAAEFLFLLPLVPSAGSTNCRPRDLQGHRIPTQLVYSQRTICAGSFR